MPEPTARHARYSKYIYDHAGFDDACMARIKSSTSLPGFDGVSPATNALMRLQTHLQKTSGLILYCR